MRNSIAIFGGTFDPPHLGHLQLAKIALDVVEKVYFVPNYDPAHKEKGNITDFAKRKTMIQLMIGDEPRLWVSDVEYRIGKSFMIDTLDSFSHCIDYDNVSLLIGLDSLENIETWHQYDRILKNYRLLVYPRNSNSYSCLDSLKCNIKTPLSLVLLHGGEYQISSSMIRDSFKDNHLDLVKPYLDGDVFEYIKNNNLYGK